MRPVRASVTRPLRVRLTASSHLIEEIESVGRSEKRELVNCLGHPAAPSAEMVLSAWAAGNSCRLSIKEQHIRLEGHLADNRSLKPKLDEAMIQAYCLALIEAERETGLPGIHVFPDLSACLLRDHG
nr:DUF29 domain-containing protein [Halochromatium salexigens]